MCNVYVKIDLNEKFTLTPETSGEYWKAEKKKNEFQNSEPTTLSSTLYSGEVLSCGVFDSVFSHSTVLHEGP
jgi:hypothetical protein